MLTRSLEHTFLIMLKSEISVTDHFLWISKKLCSLVVIRSAIFKAFCKQASRFLYILYLDTLGVSFFFFFIY